MTDPQGWHVGDLERPLAGTALDGDVPVDLTTATATVANIRRADGTVITRAVTLGNQTTNPGTWSLPWVIGDLSCAGGYSCEVEATWPGTRPQTFGPSSFQVARAIA
jgi:hypothetical protein